MFIYGYDANSRLTNRWTPAKGTTTYRYDAVGNLTNIVHPVSANISLAYDALNRLTSMVDGLGTTVYGYDDVGQLLSEDGPWADDTVSYTYNNRLRASVSVLAPNASPWTESYAYDAAKRLTNVTSAAGSFGYMYDPTRNLQVGRLTLPNGAAITNAYDSVARLLSTTLKNSQLAALNSHQYSYNTASQRTQQVFTASNYVNYAYDGMGQLTAANGKEAGGTTNRLQEQFGYVYDAAGNLNYRTNNALIQNFAVSSLNELSTVTRSGTLTVAGTTTSPATNVTVNTSNAILYADCTFASSNQSLANGTNTFTAIAKDSYGRVSTNVSVSYLPASVSYTYDSNGNLTGDGSRCFAYDDENQLTSVWVTNAWRSDFVYDGKMRRRLRREYTWSGSAWITNAVISYVYDGNLVIQERNANNLPAVSYTRGRDLSGTLQGAGGIGGLLARTDLTTGTPQHSYYHADGNGNITCLINANQAIVAKYLYDPYGNILSQSGSLAGVNLYRFSSKELHVNSGMYYYGYRFYDPNLQRWVNRDPIGEYGFEALRHRRSNGHQNISMLWRIGANSLYAFVQNQPTEHSDPLGLVSLACESAIEQADAALDMWVSEPSSENLEAYVAAVVKMIAACKPPPPPPPPPVPEVVPTVSMGSPIYSSTDSAPTTGMRNDFARWCVTLDLHHIDPCWGMICSVFNVNTALHFSEYIIVYAEGRRIHTGTNSCPHSRGKKNIGKPRRLSSKIFYS